MTENIFIQTARLVLREWKTNDREALLDLASQHGFSFQSLKADMESIDAFLNRAQQRRLLNGPSGKRASFRLAVTSPEDELIGYCGLAQLDPEPQLANFGYELLYFTDPRHQRQGYIKEAVRALLDFAREKYGIDKVFATVAPDNIASVRMLESIGYQRNDLDCSFLMKDDGKPRVLYTLL